MNNELKNIKNHIIDGQLLNSILSIVGIILGIIIILDQKEKANGKDGFLNDNDSQNLALLTKLIFIFVVFYSLYLNYQSYNLAEITNQDTSSLKLQIGASYLSLAVAIIGLYVVLTNYNDTNFQTAEVENNFL
ncbi:MAG: hypothetical protein IJO43_00480 [Bacilli bacterium]|nr:hypothetical protein [Bacilli bacterium]